MSKTERLAAALLADRERPTTHHNIIPCFVCAYKFVYRGRQGELNGRYQDWYGAGNKPVNEEIVYRWRDGRPLRMGPKGFYIDCAYCQKECESCGARIPTWRKGRRVSSKTRVCSSKCGQKARKAAA